MKCEEVMELMQRHIDGDLEQHEISLMMDHADRCSDCAAMLSRLRKLSSELEQLPRVVPKFSIVDSILPELERLHAEGATTGSNDVAVDSAAASPAPTRSNRPSRNFYRKISGVVAAGIVVGFLLFSSPGEWLKTKSNDAAMPNLASAPGAQQEAASESDAGVYSFTEMSGGAQAQDQYGAEIQPKSSISPLPKEDVPQPSAEVRNITPNDEGFTEGSGDVQEQDKVPVEVEVTQRQTLTGEEEPEMSGLAAIPAEEADSPDAKWRAVSVTGSGTFEIYKIENGELLYHSEPKEGSIGQLTWNEDGTVLSFTVTDTDGNATEWQFDTETLTESKK